MLPVFVVLSAGERKHPKEAPVSDDQLNNIVKDAAARGEATYSVIAVPAEVVNHIRILLEPDGLNLELQTVDGDGNPLFVAKPSSGVIDIPIAGAKAEFRWHMICFGIAAALVVVVSLLDWGATLYAPVAFAMTTFAIHGVRSHNRLEEHRKLQRFLKEKGF